MRNKLCISSVILTLIFAMVACGPSSTSQERSPGEVAFKSNCQTCHRLPKAKEKTDQQWPGLVERYGARAKLSTDQIAAITEYLISAN